MLRNLPSAAPRKALRFEILEPRTLFSAVPLDGGPVEDDDRATLPHHEAPAQVAMPPEGSEVTASPVPDDDHAFAESIVEEINLHADDLAAQQLREVVFIATDVADHEWLASQLDPRFEVHFLEAGSDAIEQIAFALAGASGIDAIHLVGHGEEGRLFLAGTVFDADSIQGHHRAWLEEIGTAMSPDGDILIYGCDFTAGPLGLATAALLAEATGADVAASSDQTGHADLGGNWVLESATGEIEAETLAFDDWGGLLAPISITNTSNANTLANNILGDGVSLSSASYTGGSGQSGTFTGATGYTPEWLAFGSGIILTTGHTNQVPGPNTAGNASVDAPGTGTDADLSALGGGTSYDSSILTLTVVPDSNRITMQFVFGSDEYDEYVYSQFNDVMGVWVNGTQVALTPDGQPISVNSVNQAGTFNPEHGNQNNDPDPSNGVFDSSNPNLYVNNPPDSGDYNTGMDGFTVTLSFVADVNIGVANTIKIGIADIGDWRYDSWLFIREDSLTTRTIANPDIAFTPLDTPVVIDAVANDWDADGDALFITHVVDQPVTPGGPAVTLSTGATVALNADGTLTFTPAAGSLATETFTYTISDGNGTSAVGFVTVNIDQSPEITVPGAQSTSEDTPLVIVGVSVSDPDSPSLTTTLAVPASTGTISVLTGGGATITGNGSGLVTITGSAAQINAALSSITYAPAPDYNTGDPASPINLTIVTSDATSNATSSIAITVVPVADATNDNVSTDEDVSLVFNVLTGTNGATADTFSDPGAAIVSVTQPANGAVTFLPNGQITYTPDPDWHGTDTFTYTVAAGGSTETATVTVVVHPVNDPPVAVGSIATQNNNDSDVVAGLAVAPFFFDVDGDVLTYSATGLPPGLSIHPNTGVISGTLDSSASAVTIQVQNSAMALLVQ